MSESGDYTPAPHWSGYDFASARAAYKDVVSRSYTDAVTANVTATDLVPESISTNCESPLVIVCDVTGSMGDWPATIFSKLPYLEHEIEEYLGKNAEVSFAAIGDGPTGDRYPLQIRPFVSGASLKESLEKLVHERGGGSNSVESYDLAASFYAHNCEMPNAVRKPILIFIGDEGLYSYVDNKMSESWAHVKYEGRVNLTDVFAKLKKKFNVYVIRRPYGCTTNNRSASEIGIEEQWIGLLGADHVSSLPTADRVVDVIFGILGKEAGKVDYFEKELKERQLPDKDGKQKVDVVMKSLHTILALSDHVAPPPVTPGKSVSPRDPSAQKSKPLI